MKKYLTSVLALLLVFVLVACTDGSHNSENEYYYPNVDNNVEENNNEFSEIVENPFIDVADNANSNISLSVSTASYSFLRTTIQSGYTIDKNQVRVEEIVNYFNYSYQGPSDNDLFGINSYVYNNPWNDASKLLIVGMQAKSIDPATFEGNNLVFLVDVSGSMAAKNKLPLAKDAMYLLVDQLADNDRVTIVTYASGVKTYMDGVKADDKAGLKGMISELSASGGTSGQKGLELAYQKAEQYFIEGGNNRIILLTDGDFNIGMSDSDSLEEYIAEKRRTGIYFSAFGFGYGNYKDEKLERIAKAGNGVHYYIGNEMDAKKAFVDDIDGTILSVARDAKAQISFSDNVLQYRLIGYENRQLTDEEFENHETDAGEIGSGHQVTAIYELITADAIDTSMDQTYADITVRWKNVDVNDDEQFEQTDEVLVYDSKNNGNDPDILFIISIVEFSLILRDSEFKNTANINNALNRIKDLAIIKADEYKQDFVNLLNTYIEKYSEN